MDDISHLGFDSPPTPAIVWGEFGMPIPEGDGRRLRAAALAELNRAADHEGWDASTGHGWSPLPGTRNKRSTTWAGESTTSSSTSRRKPLRHP
ncbi:MAG: hypothetical protein QG671_2287 [Actinomycetota bacterium]|jgi:hypothetical protein|nr:hypothetical protein [Actinomycetota bacterium]